MAKYIDRSKLPSANSLPAVIVGLDAMGAIFGRGRQCIANWIRKEGFPAARLPDGQWFTTPSLVDNWVLSRNAVDPYTSAGAAAGVRSTPREHLPRWSERQRAMAEELAAIEDGRAEPLPGEQPKAA